MIVPLEDEVFNRCKSNIAWLETARSGTITVAPFWESWAVPGVYAYEDDFFDTAHGALTEGEKWWGGWDYIQNNLLLSEINRLRAKVVDDLT
jgi:hypothetical protein